MTFLLRCKFVVAMIIALTLFAFLLPWQSLKSNWRIQGVGSESFRRSHRVLVSTTTQKDQGTRVQPVQRVHNQKEVSPMSPFEPEIQEDFQTVEGDQPRIRHIIHFIFITDLEGKYGIPATFKANVESFVHFNPSWKYYFWNELSGRLLIARKYPELLSTWDNYKHVINKADALRYVVLHEFGGVYSDLDMVCRRSLNRTTMKYACILTPEPFEHSSILFRSPFLLSTAFMMCRPKHPFMKQSILSLPNFANGRSILSVAGPIFLTTQFKLYNKFRPGDSFRAKLHNDSNSPYFYKGTLREDHKNCVYVANTHYFMSSHDKALDFYDGCNATSTPLVKRGCFLLKHKKKKPRAFKYTDHNWRHMYSIRNSTKMVPVTSVIPKDSLKIWRPRKSI